MGYDLEDRRLVVNPEDAKTVNRIYRAYLEHGCVSNLRIHLEEQGIRSKRRVSKTGKAPSSEPFPRR